jgi:hypothetical protein
MSKSKKNSRKSKTVKNQTKRGPGAPQKPVKWPRSAEFTLDKAYALNPDVCKLTIRSRAKTELKKMGIEETKKAGRPAFTYAVRANVVRRTEVAPISPVPVNTDGNQTVNTETPANTPAVETTVAPVIEQAPVAEVATPEAVAVGGEPVAA